MALALVLAGGCTDTQGTAVVESPGLGSVQIGLQVPSNFEIDTVTYQISHAAFSRTGTLDVRNSSTIRGVVGGLPIGTGYQVTLSATDAAHKFSSCAGSSTFDVNPDALTQVSVGVACHLVPTTSPPPSVPVPYPAVVLLAGALLGAGLFATRPRRR